MPSKFYLQTCGVIYFNVISPEHINFEHSGNPHQFKNIQLMLHLYYAAATEQI